MTRPQVAIDLLSGCRRPLSTRNETNLQRGANNFIDFVEALPTEAQWLEARKRAGVSTPARNQNALKLILGHAGIDIFHENTQSPLSHQVYLQGARR